MAIFFHDKYGQSTEQYDLHIVRRREKPAGDILNMLCIIFPLKLLV